MPSASFELFEYICGELKQRRRGCYLPIDEITEDKYEDLQAEVGGESPVEVFGKALKKLDAHFTARGARMPFKYDLDKGKFLPVDLPFIDFVISVSSIRGAGRESRKFELATYERLSRRATGILHRVGWPRKTKKTKVEFLAHLKQLGFNKRVIFGQEKDGGLDIVWLPPFGSVPYQPIVSFQCKNGLLDIGEADKSFATGSRTLACHRTLQAVVHTNYVIFNDYVDRRRIPPKPFQYVVLGLSDLATLKRKLVSDVL